MARKAAPKAASGQATPAPSPRAAARFSDDSTSASTPAGPRSSPASKTEIINSLWEETGLGKGEVTGVFTALGEMVAEELGKKGPGAFVIPGLLKLKVARRPATKAKQGVNPFTREPMTIEARPARNVVRAVPMKALKELV